MINNIDNEYRYQTTPNGWGNLTRMPVKADMDFVSPIDQITGESVMPQDTPLVPLIPDKMQSITRRDPNYSQGFLQKYIGRNMTVQFLIGANGALVDRTGVLMQVGESFIVLRPIDSDDLLMCDLYSIKFVTIYR